MCKAANSPREIVTTVEFNDMIYNGLEMCLGRKNLLTKKHASRNF